MKIKFLISMAAAAVISSNACALEISKGKLLSHKEWATAGAKASYLPGTKTRQNLQRETIKGKMLTNSDSSIFAETESTTANLN